ncbi:MAG: hypothetical protein KDA84_16160, partial [Planctomycetaceae bacterium]|nr:hypothetical protein [Planctomycetaceae bacterium]
MGTVYAVGTTTVTSTSKPVVSASIGEGVDANVTAIGKIDPPELELLDPNRGAFDGDIFVRAFGRGEADSYAQASGGGIGGQIGVPNAISVIEPTVDAFIGSDSDIVAGGNIVVHALLDYDIPPTLLTNDEIGDVDAENDTIAFDFPLNNGTTVQYNVSDGVSIIPGLVSDRLYNVLTSLIETRYTAVTPAAGEIDNTVMIVTGDLIRIDENFAGLGDRGSVYRYTGPTASLQLSTQDYQTASGLWEKVVQLGNAFDANTDIDPDTDTIRFAQPHNFQAGDRVFYNPLGGFEIVEPWQSTDLSSVFYVKLIKIGESEVDGHLHPVYDAFRIRLVKDSETALADEGTLLDTFSSGDVNREADTLTIPSHSFSLNQQVTYQAANVAFTAVDVNETSNILTISNHGYLTGDSVVYRRSGTTPDGNPLPSIGNLTEGETYNVIKVSDNNLQLSERLSFDETDLTVPTDTTLSTTINLAGFQEGEAVVFVRQGMSSQSELIGGETYYVVNATSTTFQLSSTRGGEPIRFTVSSSGSYALYSLTPIDLSVFEDITFSDNDVTGSSVIEKTDHGFENGLAVTYLYTQGDSKNALQIGQTYYVVNATNNTFQLSESVDGPAVTIPDADTSSIQTHTLSVIQTQHELNLGIEGLEDGRTYYVRDIDGDKFKLSETRNGPAIDISVAASGGIHRIGTLGIDLRASSTPDDFQTLHFNVGEKPSGNAIHKFFDASGNSLTSIFNVTGDGISSATSLGGGGALLSLGVTTATLTAKYNVNSQILSETNHTTSLTAGHSIIVQANSRTRVTAYADAAGGGGIRIGTTTATADVTEANTIARIGTDAIIHADFDFLLNAESNHQISTKANSPGGGIGGGARATNRANLVFKTLAEVASGSTITSGDTLKVHATSTADVRSFAYAFAGAGI